MGKTAHTWPSWLQARDNIGRGPDGRVKLPRFVVHPPRPGDVHVLDKKMLVKLFPYLPLDYRNGLKVVELRARVPATVGLPWGTYHGREKRIRLYSLPALEWPIQSRHESASRVFHQFGGVVSQERGQGTVRRATPIDAARFLFVHVFAHELGHHFDRQYRCKWKVPSTLHGAEVSANRHVNRLNAWGIFDFVLTGDGPKSER